MVPLRANEIRVLGVLIEKEHTTPDQYPLSLNALTTGCNQKSNREPVLDLSETEVQEAVDSLMEKGFVTEVAFGSRVRKYRQRFGNTEFSDFRLSRQEQGLLCVLFLRGAQTPGELRVRSNRLCSFNDVNEVEQVLNDLMSQRSEPFVAKLPREAGKREHRYVQLFCPDAAELDSVTAESEPVNTGDASDSTNERIQALELKVAQLETEIEALKNLLN